MGNKAVMAVLSVFFVSLFIGTYLYAESDMTAFQAKLKEIRAEKEVITGDYKKNLDKVNRASDDELVAIKKDFHAKRDVCLKERTDRQNELLKNYEAKMAPILEKERKVKEEMGPGEGSNFAKRKK